MAKYINKTSRLSVKFFDGDTNELLFEISNRNWMDIGEMFAAHNVSELIDQTIAEQNLPDNVIVLTSGEYIRQ